MYEPSFRARFLEGLLEQKTRRRVYDGVRMVPGIHVRRLQRDLDLGMSVVQHHLRVFERHGFVVHRQEGKRRAYFVPEEVLKDDQYNLYFLRHRTSRRILIALLENPELTLRGLCQRVPLRPSTVAYHLKRLANAGLIAPVACGRTKYYDVVKRDEIKGILERYGATFRKLA